MDIQFDLFDDSFLVETFISRLKKKMENTMPRLDHEPIAEYNEHLREEIRFTAIEKINEYCDKLFPKKEEQWKNL